ncbi:MAG: mechanosensitive ion channel family protein [Thermoanaerobaculia bacterium]|nr:mechanosensitive ion channel family protein [Thermoanaerobaculia bacterium]
MSISEAPILGNPVHLWTAALGQAALFMLAFYLLKLIVKRRFANAAETESRIDDFVLHAASNTKAWLIIFPVFYFATRILTMPALAEKAIVNLTVVAAFAQVGLWVSGIVQFWLTGFRQSADPAAATSMRMMMILVRIVVWSAIFLLILDGLGYNVTTLLAGLGIGGVAVALALQAILGDLFASLSIVIDKPFVVGDFISVDLVSGTVEQVGLKTTRVRSISGEQVIVSNSDLLKSRVRNFQRMTERRQIFTFGVMYETPVDKVALIPGMVREIVESIENTRFDRAHFKAFGPSSLDFEVVWWMLSPELVRAMDAQQDINLRIMAKFTAEGIGFAYPTQTVHLAKQ